jgi:hypothetical protein
MTHPSLLKSPSFLLRLGLASFGLSLGWEWGHLPAYLCPANGLTGKLALVLPAGTGDVALTLVLATLAWVVQRETACPLRLTGRRLLVFLVGGTGLAIVIERAALAIGIWSYSALMPLIPGLGVGWLPLLYTVAVPPLAAALACPARGFFPYRPRGR